MTLIKNMKTLKNKMVAALMTSTLLLSGCGRADAAPAPTTPKEAVECTMNSIKDLDMTTLNKYTDNYVQTYCNWIGIPIENEYRTFNELLQPRSNNSRRYQTAYRLDQKMMENLTWEITQVREAGDTAEIDMTITNIDMLKVMEQLETQILESIIEVSDSGIAQIIKETVTSSVNANETLISLIDALDDSDICTNTVTVFAYQEQGQWKVHLTHDFINAFSGNMYADIDSENIAKLEEQLERKANEWAEQFEQDANRWADSVEQKVNHWAEQFE